MKATPTLSDCHQKPVKVADSDEGTNYYICTGCNQPCDQYVVTPTSEDTNPWEVTTTGGINNIRVHLKNPKDVAEYGRAMQAIEALGRSFGRRTSEGELFDILNEIYLSNYDTGPDARLTFTEAKAALSAYIQQKCDEARIDEARKRVASAERLLKRSRKWQLTEAGRHDMIVGEELMPAQDRLRQLTPPPSKEASDHE